MLRYIYAKDLHKFSSLAHSMYVDRADQFKTRLGWDVQIDHFGEERDQYDALNPLYVIWEQAAMAGRCGFCRPQDGSWSMRSLAI